MNEALLVRGLTKSYGGKKAVDHLDLSVRRGTVFGLLGANGAGKSTAIECILGTKQADCGTVRLLGQDPKERRRELFQRIGVQFQEGDHQPEIKVSELCEETASLYRDPADWRGLTIFLTSHFMDEVEALCDKICILKKGSAVFLGTVEQAMERCGCARFEDAYLQLSDWEADE